MLLFILDLKNTVHSAKSQKAHVPADEIKGISYNTEHAPAGSWSPAAVSLQGRMTSPGDTKTRGRGTREVLVRAEGDAVPPHPGLG